MNIPKLRFKDNNGNDYPQWEKKKLGDIGNIISGGTPSSSNKEYWNGHINWFTPSEVGKTKFVSESIRKITEKGLKNSSAKLLPKGTILLSSRATIGEKSILLNSATTNQGFQSIITNNEAINEFIYYYIDTLKSELIKQSSGSTFLEISNTILKKLKIYIPNLQEQEKIANFLSTVDKKIENLVNTITSLENQKKGLLQQIFSQKLRFKDENGNNYPNWEKKKLGDICKFTGGGTPSTSILKYWNGTIPWISSSDLQTNTIHKIKISRYITNEAVSNSSTKIIPKNSILIVSRVGVGKVAISNCVLCTSQDFTNITEINGNTTFYAYLLKYKMEQLTQNTQGTSIKGITTSDIKNIKLIVPIEQTEQTKIADFLSEFDRKLDNQKAQLEHWQQIKKGLLQQMFV